MTSYPSLRPALTEPCKIGDNLEVDVVMSRSAEFNSEVTTNPVEDGFPVADHVRRSPIPLKMKAIFTPTPVTWLDRQGVNVNRIKEVTDELQAIYMAGDPITIKTADAIYRDMVLVKAPVQRTEKGIHLEIDLDFMQVRIVRKKTAATDGTTASDEADGKTGETGQDAGQASTTDIGTGLKTVENTTTVDIDTSFLDYKAEGTIQTGWEQTAVAAGRGILASFVAGVATSITRGLNI